jgi:hypothetical protein
VNYYSLTYYIFLFLSEPPIEFGHRFFFPVYSPSLFGEL